MLYLFSSKLECIILNVFAFQQCSNVILIFSIRESGKFQGTLSVFLARKSFAFVNEPCGYKIVSDTVNFLDR